MARTKVQITKARYEATCDFDYVSAGRQYDVETRSNSKHADFRRTDGSGIGTYVQMWQFKRAIADGSVVQVAA
jgi:hypothetical protein